MTLSVVPLWKLKNIAKAATYKSFLRLSYKNAITFFVKMLFNIFMRQTLTEYFWGVHRNMNCTFALNVYLRFSWIEKVFKEERNRNRKGYCRPLKEDRKVNSWDDEFLEFDLISVD